MLDFLPALLVDLALYLVNFTLQHVLADRLLALGRKDDAEVPLAVFSGLYTFAYVAGTLGLGKFADRTGWRRASMSTGLLVVALVPLLMVAKGLELGDWSLFASIGVLGAGSALFWPAQQARIADRSGPDKLPAALARFNVGWTAGKALGNLFAGVLYRSADGTAHPIYALLAAMAAALLALGLTASDRAPEVPKRPEPTVTQQARKRGFLIAALAVNFALWGLGAAVSTFIPVLGRELEIGETGQGALVGGLVFAQSAIFLVLGGRTGWHYKRRFLIAVPFLGALTALAFYAASNVAVATVATIVAGVIGGCAYGFSLFYSLDYDEKRGFRMGVNEAVLGLGGLLPLAGSGLAHLTHSPRVPYVFAGAVCLACGFLAIFSLRVPREYR